LKEGRTPVQPWPRAAGPFRSLGQALGT